MRAGWACALGMCAAGLAWAETAQPRVDTAKLLLHPEPARQVTCGRPAGDWTESPRYSGLEYELDCRPTAIPGRWVYGLRFFNTYPHPLTFSVAMVHPGGRVSPQTASVAACAVTGELASFVLPTPCGLKVDVDVQDAAAGAPAK